MITLTDYHAKYFAHELTKRCSSDSAEKLAGALVDAQVDLNPHQVEAALFAFRSPLSKGALLADEVGLGKTIEAGLVISQKWAERKRRILVITPANLRKQWHQEIQAKFFLPCAILETRSYNEAIKRGNFRPFEATDTIIICSFQFARAKAADINVTRWNLVVIDEAHRLRNVYKPSNVIANTLKLALKDAPKLLLTATPLQNSLLELFGLVSFIDEHTFGDLKSFREQFAYLNDKQVFNTLKARLQPVCHRTLRRQVTAYVPYTRRHPLVQPFTPEEGEDRLYHLVSDYLQRDNLQALPASQRSLMTLVLRKLLASSTFAIAGALDTLSRRLRARLGKQQLTQSLEEELDQDYEGLDETAEEWSEDAPEPEPLSEADRAALEREITDLEAFRTLAVSITYNAKGKALLTALSRAFTEADRLGAAHKAIIFTESRRTQEYLLRVLADSPYTEGIVLFNGSNTDTQSRQIYANWLQRHAGTDRLTGSGIADMRSALVDYFREQGQIMIATEAGAEGINLQFCSLIVNYDLPWNPQRIEQRIGRCHRYGQKHDVVVVNFLNQTNAADQRVFQLLSEKFLLFEGVFGASDEVLGAIESGVDFEKRIADIYQRCRSPEEINTSFDELQRELSQQIDEAMTRTRQQLLENFDQEVHEKLRVNLENSRTYLNRYERMLMDLTHYELRDHAEFVDGSAFQLKSCPFPGDIQLGLYELPRRSGEAHLYRLGHPLAEQVLRQAKSRVLPLAEISFNYSGYESRISVLEPYIGQSGELLVSLFTVESLDQAEDYLLFASVTESGHVLEEDVARRLLSLPATSAIPFADAISNGEVRALVEQRKTSIQRSISERNAKFFESEAEKLDCWADDLKVALEREIKDIDRQIKEAKRAATLALTLEEKLAGQKQVKALESQRNGKRRALFDAQDEIDRRREQLISEIEGKLNQQASLERCEDDVSFARRITESTNFQNQIGSRDFAALDEQQERIAAQLRIANIEYHYKESDDTPNPDSTNFTLVEATTALACLEQEQTCNLCTRVLANRNSLWSFEEVYPDGELYRTRYHRLFRPDRSVRTIWRAVQTQRVVLERMQADARSSAGIRRTFFENARWLVLNIVFLQLRSEQGETLDLTSIERTAVSIKTIEVAEALWSAAEAQGLVSRRSQATGGEPYEQTRHFRSVFCDSADCQRLRSSVLTQLNQAQAQS